MVAKRKVIVLNPAGLHARPSAAIAEAVRKSQSRVQIRSRDEVVDASSILELLTLGAEHGSELLLIAKGPDAEQILQVVVEELERHYD